MLDFDDADVYNALLKVAIVYGVDSSSSTDMEAFLLPGASTALSPKPLYLGDA